MENVGNFGVFYPGFYATYSLLKNCPALMRSALLCIVDFF
jgi:hypothetical protein